MADMIFEEDYDNDGEMMMMTMMMMMMTMVYRNTFILSRGLCQALEKRQNVKKLLYHELKTYQGIGRCYDVMKM